MATRNIRGRRIVDDSSSDETSSEDELPDLRHIDAYKLKAVKLAPTKRTGTSDAQFQRNKASTKSTVRRRKLGVIADNPLLRPLGDNSFSTPTTAEHSKTSADKKTIAPQRIELRARKTLLASPEDDAFSEAGSVHEETILEDFSGSDFTASQSSEEEKDGTYHVDDDDAPMFNDFVQAPPLQPKGRTSSSGKKCISSPSAQLLAEATEAEERRETQRSASHKGARMVGKRFLSSANDLARPLSKLHFNELEASSGKSLKDGGVDRAGTPPSPTAESIKPTGLASPSKKISRIPATPHHPHTDSFWNQEFIDEWNDEHSPKKQLFPPSAASKSPLKKASGPKKEQLSQSALQKAAKKAFEQAKHDLADRFVLELDQRITNNKLSKLSAATGGIRIEWTHKLHTTAGRANWKRETIKSKTSEGETVPARYRHHASIELSTKVIDDEHRLLNVIAHEFCHLANFMVSGITTNPHGKEFKTWAAKVTSAFCDRDIDVTTKHSYDIDFKYVWECTVCLTEFKRHSKSINPERHRCGACKSELKQTKPVPRSNKGKESEYQKFMKEHMRLIKNTNPGSPQKEIMKTVASRWGQREKAKSGAEESIGSSQSIDDGKDKKVEGVVKILGDLTVVDLT